MYKIHTNSDPGLAMIIKHRDMPGSISKMYLVGDVADKDVIIIDDMLDTGGTMCEAVKELKKYGAKSVDVFVTHALFSGKAYENIRNSSIDKLVVTNTIPA
jgi:ribose-phosphate pyrophosphokinase